MRTRYREITLTLLAALTLVLPAAPRAAEPAPATHVLGPTWFAGCVSYYQTFDEKIDAPAINTDTLVTDLKYRVGPQDNTVKPVELSDKGLFGKALLSRDWRAPMVLKSPTLSPHRPWALSFWWALTTDLPIDGGFSLCTLTGKQGIVTALSRGKGDWCALQRPAGVLQVLYFPGIPLQSHIYDRDLLGHYDLKAGSWHHTAIVFKNPSTVQQYTDGKLVCQINTTGREFAEEDAINSLTLGSALYIDELAVLNRAVDGDMIADYYQGISQLRYYRSLEQ